MFAASLMESGTAARIEAEQARAKVTAELFAATRSCGCGMMQARVNKKPLLRQFTRMEKLQSFVEEGPLELSSESSSE